ncbi:hypothetical protein ACFX13_031296 [Malus domestica]
MEEQSKNYSKDKSHQLLWLGNHIVAKSIGKWRIRLGWIEQEVSKPPATALYAIHGISTKYQVPLLFQSASHVLPFPCTKNKSTQKKAFTHNFKRSNVE